MSDTTKSPELKRAQAYADAITEECRRLERVNQALVDALEQFANCDLNDDNCASLEVATKRIRNIARAALELAKGKA